MTDREPYNYNKYSFKHYLSNDLVHHWPHFERMPGRERERERERERKRERDIYIYIHIYIYIYIVLLLHIASIFINV